MTPGWYGNLSTSTVVVQVNSLAPLCIRIAPGKGLAIKPRCRKPGMSTAKYRIWTWMDLSSLCILLLYCISFDLIGLLYNIRNNIYNISTFGILRVKKCHDSCIVHHCSVCRNQCRCQANRRLDEFFVECGEAALFWLALKSGSSPTHRKSLFRRFLPFRSLIASFFHEERSWNGPSSDALVTGFLKRF